MGKRVNGNSGAVQDSRGITASLLVLSGIDRQDRFTIFSEILDLSIPIARSRADFAGKHPWRAPAIDACSVALVGNRFVRLALSAAARAIANSEEV